MKLGKLLGVGKSFFGGGDSASYRLSKHVGLPKFNEGKNPFAPKTAEAAPAAPAMPAGAPHAVAAMNRENKMENKSKITGTCGLTVAQAVALAQKTPAKYTLQPAALPVVPAVARVAPKPTEKPVVAAKPSRPGWTTKLNPFRPAESVVPAVAQQTELSLDSVKVVHNDLADADVEIVPVKSHAGAPAAVPVLPPARQAWEYLGESLLKSS